MSGVEGMISRVWGAGGEDRHWGLPAASEYPDYEHNLRVSNSCDGDTLPHVNSLLSGKT